MSSREVMVVFAGLLAVSGALAPGTAQAQSPAQFELSPFAAYRLGGELRPTPEAAATQVRDGSGWGASLGWYRDAESFYELLYSRRVADLGGGAPGAVASELTLEYLHIGGTLLFPQPAGQRAFVSGTLGLTRLDARPGSYAAENKFSASLGGGLRFPLAERLEVTLGARGYWTLVDANTRIVCLSDQGEAGCLLRTSGSSLWEIEAFAGLTLRFGHR